MSYKSIIVSDPGDEVDHVIEVNQVNGFDVPKIKVSSSYYPEKKESFNDIATTHKVELNNIVKENGSIVMNK